MMANEKPAARVLAQQAAARRHRHRLILRAWLLAVLIGNIQFALPVFAQTVLLSFTTQPGTTFGTAPWGLMAGSSVSGQIQVHLESLPEASYPLPTIANYDYFKSGGGIPGYYCDFIPPSGPVHYDSALSLSPDSNIYHAYSHILLQNEPTGDYFYFYATQQDVPYYIQLQLQDLASPYSLLDGLRFPDNVNDLEARTFGNFVGSDLSGANAFQARISTLSMVIIPEPATVFLCLAGGVMATLFRYCRRRGSE